MGAVVTHNSHTVEESCVRLVQHTCTQRASSISSPLVGQLDEEMQMSGGKQKDRKRFMMEEGDFCGLRSPATTSPDKPTADGADHTDLRTNRNHCTRSIPK